MENYTLKSGNTTLSIDSKGAQISSFKVGDTEYIWQKGKEWNGSAPILFPIVGELCGEGKTTLIGGKRYKVPMHGFAGGKEFSFEALSDSCGIFSFHSDEDTLAVYPFQFTFSVKFEVFEGGWKQDFIIKNETDGKMWYTVGAHPGFNCPLFEGDSYNDYRIEFECSEENRGYRINDDTGLVDLGIYAEALTNGGKTLPLTHEIFSLGALIYKEINSRSVKFLNKQNRGFKMDFPTMDYLGIWKMLGTKANYVCIEPWTGMNDCYGDDGIFENKRGMRAIEKGETECHGFSITVI